MLILWSVFFCEIQSLIVSTQVRTIQADEDEKYSSIFKKVKEKNFENMYSLWT